MEKIKLSDNNLNKKQPSNLEAEQALLGSILVNNDIIDEVSNIVNPSSFYDPAHTKIYEVIETIIEKKISEIKIILNANILEKKSKLRGLFEKSKELVIIPTYKDTSVALM